MTFSLSTHVSFPFSAGSIAGSSGTSDSDDSYDEIDVPLNKLRRVLLG